MAVVDELDEWLALLQNPRTAIEFVGDCGYGKSTHLLAFLVRIPSAQYVYFPVCGPRPALPHARPALVDEAQRMGYFRRCQMLRRSGPLVIGTHVSLASSLKRAGFEVTTIDVEVPKTPSKLSKILNSRIEASRWQADLPLTMIDESLAARLLQRFGSNVRSIEHYLYECFQATLGEQAPWPPAI